MPWGLTAADILPIVLTIGWLVILEGLLSGDNALVLAVMVRHLPKPQQKKALRYGIIGAFVFRAIALVFASYLLRYWELEVLGGLYLIFLAIRHFLSGGDHDNPEAKEAFGKGFWGTVISVELADIAFSIDSILAAVALITSMPDNLQNNHNLALTIVYIGCILGIVMMRYVATFFIKLLDRFEGLAAGSYILVAWIGLKLTGSGLKHAFHPPKINNVEQSPEAWTRFVPKGIRDFPWEMHDLVFWGGMVLIVIASLIYRPRGGKSKLEGKLVDSGGAST
ncbi:MAG: Integral rane protein TerC [Planctomycetota bacterium]|nr:Integral rane protein TerC [Planctomycetota bacterium]